MDMLCVFQVKALTYAAEKALTYAAENANTKWYSFYIVSILHLVLKEKNYLKITFY